EADAQTLVLPTLQLMAGSLNGSPDSVPAGDRAVYGSLLLQARLYITSRLHESISVDKLCGHLNCSPATLSRVFKRHNGVRAYIQEQRLRMAARRLVSQRDAHLRISDIACECGFSSDAHFSRAFRQRFGLSPSDARNLGAVPPTKRPGFGQGTTSEPREYERWVMESLT
ncbi:MAG: AraC family transcriptional regulator, partial [Pseudohongiella sp.]